MHSCQVRKQLAVVWVVMLLPAWHEASAEWGFRRHTINADSTYSACAAFDVNRDGQLDIVCGGYWYEGPKWKRHFLREVRVIRGRYDGYAHLPLDVNGDGWLDFVSANYRSNSIDWVENPGKANGPWTRHLVDEPGPMETGRLVDVDGDGRVDLLPNGTRFAAWWEIIPAEKGKQTKPQWIRHELPAEAAGHGIGFGDVNGDGRNDIVGPRGWFEAPEDRRQPPWRWHREFELHRDCGLPILVVDPDGDGDNDIVYGRGHHIGLYWLEQGQSRDAARAWTRHAIDTSWSQAHSLLWADLDSDGRDELIAGKRYMGHDGKDPGENDPLVIYSYQFDRDQRTWRRRLISFGGGAGFGLDPKAIDLDRDGDLDLVCPGRSGLFLCENLLRSKETIPAAQRSSKVRPTPEYADHTRLLVFKDSRGQAQPVKTAVDWGIRRSHILENFQRVTGKLPAPERRVALDVKVVGDHDAETYTRRKIRYRAETDDWVPAYLLIPKRRSGRAPAMLCLHQTTRIGKDEPAGIGGQATLYYAHELAQRGYVCLVPDYPSFGEYSYDFATDGREFASGSIKAVWNNIRGLDLLESLPEVDSDRIGAIGHSLGGHNAILTAGFDQRVRVVVTSCGFTALAKDDIPSWTGLRYMPRIASEFNNDLAKLPFDFHELVAAIAPRPLFVNAPLGDRDFSASGVRDVMTATAQVYQLRGAADRQKLIQPDSPHDFPDEVRKQAYDWLDGWLK